VLTVSPDCPGTTIAYPHAALKIASCPYLDEIPPLMSAITRKIMVMMKVKIPYGIAKHGFFLAPVRHPRHAIIRPKIPMTIFPAPIPLAPEVIPGIWKTSFCSEVIGILPSWIKPKITLISAMSPINAETANTIFEHICLVLSL